MLLLRLQFLLKFLYLLLQRVTCPAQIRQFCSQEFLFTREFLYLLLNAVEFFFYFSDGALKLRISLTQMLQLTLLGFHAFVSLGCLLQRIFKGGDFLCGFSSFSAQARRRLLLSSLLRHSCRFKQLPIPLLQPTNQPPLTLPYCAKRFLCLLFYLPLQIAEGVSELAEPSGDFLHLLTYFGVLFITAQLFYPFLQRADRLLESFHLAQNGVLFALFLRRQKAILIPVKGGVERSSDRTPFLRCHKTDQPYTHNEPAHILSSPRRAILHRLGWFFKELVKKKVFLAERETERGWKMLGVAILAAGRAKRYGRPKVLERIRGRPILLYAVEAFRGIADRIVVVVPPGEEERYRRAAGEVDAVVAGGDERWQSAIAGIRALSGCDVVLVHDAARPAVPRSDIARLVKTLETNGAAALVYPVTDTLKVVKNGRVKKTLPRNGVYRALTPQGFRMDTYRLVEERYYKNAPDEAWLFEKAGIPVTAVAAEGFNPKLTYRSELRLFEALLEG